MLLVIYVLGCNSVTAPPSNLNLVNTNPAPDKPVKVVDLPSIIGKSRDEIKMMVRGVPTGDDPLEYSFPQGKVTIQFTKDKPRSISFNFKTNSVGDSTVLGTDRADQLGDIVGIDVHGKTPNSINGPLYIYEQEIGGKKVRLVFKHGGGKFSSVIIEPK